MREERGSGGERGPWSSRRKMEIVLRALELYRSALVLAACLPDAVTESELER